MENKEVRKKVYSMILPIIIENVLEMTAGIVSMGMIGRIDVVAVAAQGVCARIVGILWCIFKGISIGATVLIARAYGAEDSKKIKKVAQQTLVSSLVLELILQFFLYWKARELLGIFNPKPETMEAAILYLRMTSWGLPFQFIMIEITGILQGMGNSKTPMIISLIMNIVNIIFGYLLIFGNFGFPAMGLKGAALAIIIAQFISAIVGLYVLFSSDGILHSMRNRSFFKIDYKEIYEIYKVGIPSAFESLFWQFAAIILTKVMLSFGEVPFAAYQFGLQAESISEMPALGFGVAATTFIGQSLGANDKELGKKYMREIKIGGMMVMSIGTIILLFFPYQAMRLLTNDKDVIALGVVYLRLMGLIQIPQNLAKVYNGALKGAGYTNVPMIVAGIGLWGIRIPLSLALTYIFHMDIIAIWVVICIDQAFRFILSVVWYKIKDIFAEDCKMKKNSNDCFSFGKFHN